MGFGVSSIRKSNGNANKSNDSTKSSSNSTRTTWRPMGLST